MKVIKDAIAQECDHDDHLFNIDSETPQPPEMKQIIVKFVAGLK